MKKILLIIFISMFYCSPLFAGWFDFLPNTADTYRVSMKSDVAILTSANDFGAEGQLTGTDYFSFHNTYRIRQSGTLNRVKFYAAAISTEFRIKVWRLDGTTYDLVGESEDISGSVNSLTTHEITLSSTIAVQEGDYVGYELHVNADVLTSRPGDSATHQIDGLATDTNIDWEAAGTTTGMVPIEIYVSASPVFAIIGDSIAAGHPDNYSFLESTRTDNFANTIAGALSSQISAGQSVDYTYQNLGKGSALTGTIAFNMQYYAVPAKPKFMLLEGGVNNIATAGAKQDFLDDWGTILDFCEANNIRPVVVLIMPWTDGTNTEMQTRDEWNTDLTTLVNTYSLDQLIINTDSNIGEFRTGGDPGNLWDIQAIYDADGIHYNDAGYQKIAETIYNAMVADAPQTTVSGITISGTIN